MTDIYDQLGWPPPSENPLILLFGEQKDWYSNVEINTALSTPCPDRKRCKLSNWPNLAEQLGPDTCAEPREVASGVKRIQRLYSRKALVLIAMRAHTSNAAAFRDWIAEYIGGGARHG